MKQICRFNSRPATITDGGHKKGRWIIWLNLNVSELEVLDENQSERFQSVTERLVLDSNSIFSFLNVVEPAHIALATSDELAAILDYFQAYDNVEAWKVIRKIQVQGYDCSDKVNCFYLNGFPLWLDKATRVGLVNSITIEKNVKRTATCLWFGSRCINVNVDVALAALSQLELYAHECYNVTAQHLVQIEQCETVDELYSFDISADYPEMLRIKTE